MARRPGLGRGLDALIPGNEEQQDLKSSIPTQGILQVSVDSIHPNPQQPRTHMDQAALEDLSSSIQEHGIIQPLIVSEDEDGQTYTLIAGERRWRAAKLAGLSLVPVIERSVSEQGQLELALIENLQRRDLSPLEMAEAYRQLAENFSLTHDQIAQRVGKSRTSVTNTLRLLSLSDAAKSALAEDKISEGHARTLLGLSKPQAQDAALQTVLNLSLNVRQTEALVKKLNGEKPPSTPKPEPAPEILALENKLRSFFGTKVHLNKSGKGGSLVIYYYSEEELNTILDKFLTE